LVGVNLGFFRRRFHIYFFVPNWNLNFTLVRRRFCYFNF
jgi:hypothetical protein